MRREDKPSQQESLEWYKEMCKETYRKAGEIICVPTDRITSQSVRNRTGIRDKALEELADSIAANGLLEPIQVLLTSDDTYQIISGERRYQAAKLAGMTEIPCVVLGIDEKDVLLYRLIGRQQEIPLHYTEEAMLIDSVMLAEGYGIQDIAERLGKLPSYIKDKLSILSLSQEVIDTLSENDIPESFARLLIGLPAEEEKALLDRIITEQLGYAEAKKAAERLRNPNTGQKRIFIFKNIHVFTNTIDKAVDTMTASGVAADSVKTETDEYVRYEISIKKTG